MSRMLSLLFVIFFVSGVSAQKNKQNILKINFGGIKYWNLYLVITLENNMKKNFPGRSKDEVNWNFSYPDSLYSHIKYLALSNENNVDTTANNLRFMVINGKDTMAFSNFAISRGTVSVSPKFVKRESFPKTEYYNDLKQVESLRTSYLDSYQLGNGSDTEFTISIEAFGSGYSLFTRSQKNAGLSYQECLIKYSNLVRKYPGSNILMSRIAATLNFYQSKEDVEMIYNLFSPIIKDTYSGRRVNEYIHLSRFDNIVSSPIFQTTQKYNFVLKFPAINRWEL